MRTLGPRTPGTALALLAAALPLLAAVFLTPAGATTAVPDGAPPCTGSRPTVPVPTAVRADPAVRVDACGEVFFAEPARPAGPAALNAAPGSLPAALKDTFALESLPGSSRTIYLRFTGLAVTGTAFNADYGVPTLVATPFSMTPPADTAFTPFELGEIQRAWQVVAEDFAPFDVNVTTREPAPEALARTSASDPAYGVTLVATTGGGPLQRACRCGGLAYVGVFGSTGTQRDYRQPGFVFGAISGESVGEAASHEAGHMFGLYHDGTTSEAYYDGRAPWAPIMGSGYDQPVTQWSAGEYLGASNPQDDLAVIARTAPVRADDHGDTSDTATGLALGTAATGMIATRTDVDAFTFTAGGRVSITVAGLDGKSDLDVGLRLVDASGATVVSVDAPTTRQSSSRAGGLGAAWTGTLPRTAAPYTLLVDGVGTGAPLVPGRYSDYGSLGTYRVLVAAR